MNTESAIVPVKSESKRVVILHYHLFKNAGTSIDSAFKEELGNDKWTTKEFDSEIQKNRLDVSNWIDSNKNVICFSSHTAVLPVPEIDNTDVIPVIFVRNPIDRIASVYSFERNQKIDSFGAKLAKKHSFARYVEERLSRKNDYQCRNFQAHRLSHMDGDETKSLEMRAMSALNLLKVVGLVEAYDKSISAFNTEFNRHELLQFTLKISHMNVTRSLNKTRQQKMEEIRSELGADLFMQLLEVNKEDLTIYRKVAERYGIAAEEVNLCS